MKKLLLSTLSLIISLTLLAQGTIGVLSGTPSAIGTYSFTITASDASSETYPHKGLKDYTARVLGLPEISVQGNGMTIADGDATPSTADFTDFGSQSVTSGSITKTYTIQNTGTDTLFVFSVTISGMAGRDYSTSFITPDTILAGGSSNLQVLFDPSVAGARNATVTINSNDADEAVYDFAITGKGIAADVNGVLYVKQGATGGGDSWNNALGSFGEALDAARNSTAIQQIWVAKGTYQPASGQSFSLVKGVDIYGHFAGTETALSQRNLSGTDTSFLKGNGSRVMYNNNNGLTPADRLDGFTITGGANVALGAGIYNSNASPFIINCYFTDNKASFGLGGGAGGAIANDNMAKPVIDSCSFTGNRATREGGAIYNSNASPIVTNSRFAGNSASNGGGIANTNNAFPAITGCDFTANRARYGGGLYNRNNSNPVVTNSSFVNDTAANDGGGIYNNSSAPKMINTLFVGNISLSGSGGAIYNMADASPIIINSSFVANDAPRAEGKDMYQEGGMVKLYNSILIDGVSGSGYDIQYSMLAGLTSLSSGNNGGNLDTIGYTAGDIFNAPAAGDYTLRPGSPVINRGKNSLYTSNATNDLAGNPRIFKTTIDMGAYEWRGFAEINIQGNSVDIADGDNTPAATDSTDFGPQNITSGSITKTYTIQNTGTDTLFISSVTITGDAKDDYSTAFAVPDTILAGGSATLQVAFDPSAAGARSATVTINSSDADEAVYDFAISGMGAAPEINVQGNNINIADGDNTPAADDATDFGSQNAAAGSITKTYAIQNTGNDTLFVTSVTITGDAKDDYSTAFAVPDTILAGGSATLQVAFDPSVAGARSAIVTINSSDADEAVYDFAITGEGIGQTTISFSPPANKTYGDAAYEITATSSSPEPISFSSSNTAVATVAKNATDNKWYVRVVAAGTATLTASQAAGSSYEAGSANATLTVGKATLTVTADARSKVYGEADPALTYTATGWKNNDNESMITGTLNRAAGEDAGEYAITQNTLSAGNNYTITYTGNIFTITKAPQTISWSQQLVAGCGGGTVIQLTATSGSGLPVNYTSANPSVATISGSTLTPVAPGSSSITATQPGDANYEAATAVVNLFTYVSENLIKQHFSDALYFVNENSRFVEWQWYKNGTAVNGATQPYYSENAPLNGTYYVVATDAGGNKTETCPLVLTGSEVETRRLKVYPNPVMRGTLATVSCNYTSAQLQGARLTITNTSGNVLRQVTNVQLSNWVRMPATSGIFIITLTLGNGQKETVNVLVR